MPAQTKIIPSKVSFVMSLPSAYHSPSTVNRNASEFVMGTVRESSACPTSRKNQILPVKLSRRGTAYPGLRSSPMTVKKALAICLDIQDRLGSVIDRCDGGV